jgi:hypothetical protein
VFDGRSHLAGFIVFKICLFASWVVVFPVVGYLIVTMSFATWLILHSALRRGLLAGSVIHPDSCYGFSSFGALNVSLLWPFLLGYAVMFSLLVTHAKPYETLIIPLCIMTAVFIIVSYLLIHPLYSCIRKTRRNVFERLKRQGDETGSMNQSQKSQFLVERLCYSSASSTPYSKSTRLVLAGMRAVTVGATAFKLFEQYHGLVGI